MQPKWKGRGKTTLARSQDQDPVPEGLRKADHVDHGFIALGVASSLWVGIFSTVGCHYLFYFYSYLPLEVIYSSTFSSVIKILWSTYYILGTMLIMSNTGDMIAIKTESLPLWNLHLKGGSM